MTATPLRREPPPFRRLLVRRVERLTSRMSRVTVGGPELSGFPVPEPAASVRLLLPSRPGGTLVMPTWTGNEFLLPDGTRPAIRTLTPRRFDPVASEIDLDIVMHEEGALPSWVATLDADGTAELDTAEGGGIALSGPARGYVPNKEVHTFVLGGDETAIPAISQIIAALPDGATVQVVIEVGSLDARFDVGTPNVDWRACSDDREPGGELVAGMRAAIERMPRDAQIWAAGEAAAVQRIRRIVFDELGLPRSQATIRGYWKHGRSGASELSAT